MSLFRRRRSGGSRARDAVGQPAPERRDGETAGVVDDQQWFVGLYLTDGSALFHVQQVISDLCGDATLVELENCGTLELIVCPRGTLDDGKLRRISPAGGPPAVSEGVTRPAQPVARRDAPARRRAGVESTSSLSP